ncbi:aryl-phospho-beta-D-glucosidase BglC (GH1 family) [Hamadaea flava]|uniref:Cellulase family glycosylhydrolase n=1 Tax=Hamadaea flava TaxID=1742688 RepID=A0ABV8LW23_9ACTN|nr:cellulase family glycosylhydrolase [Hamadaea flava]MCP2329301.1 aryl-phospho-beta-D-glucosidase BglC (GH1 family) [Hamadaea flava]
MSGFLRRHHRQVLDPAGEPILLRGVGLGNWWLPEGYMWRFGDAAASPRAIEKVIADLIGEPDAQIFWRRYRDEYIGEADVARMAEEGWNSVRLPLNARYLMDDDGVFDEDAFQLIDRFLDWCRRYGVYVVIDLHGAPGGQTGTNIDDSPNNYPELFTTPRYQDDTVRLWREIARRYRHDPIVAGYDLLNEPLPREFQYKYPQELIALYKRLIAEIREVDPDHMMILEGSNWARNWSIFDELWDDNTLLQFHKYWNSPDRDQITEYLDKREELDVPIYMGEGGENNNGWYQASFQLYEDYDIGWNFWTWKKISKLNSPATIRQPDGWQAIVDYVYGGAKPDAESARRTLFELLDNLALERCDYRYDVVDAVMRRAPLRLQAEYFGHLGEGVSYHSNGPKTPLPGFRQSDNVTVAYRASPDGAQPPAEPNFRHNLGVERADDEVMVVHLDAGEWLAYEVNTVREGVLTVTPSVTGELEFTVDGLPIGTRIPVGKHVLTVRALGPAVLDHLDVTVAS